MSKSGYKGEGKSRLFKPCVSPCKRFITAGDTHEQCVACLGAGHAAAAFSDGADCPHCERLPLRTLRSRKSLFVDGIFTSEPRGSGPPSALVGLTVRSGAGNGDGRVPISVHCLQIERPFQESSQWEKGSFLPRNGLDARPIFLRGGGDGERRWAAPIPAVWGAAGGWWLALSINLKLIGQPSSRPSRGEANSTSVLARSAATLRIGAWRFFPICILRL